MSIPAGWYPDPQQQDQLRYWDGGEWTEHQTPAQGTDPGAGSQDQAGGYGAASAPQAGGAASAPRPTAEYGAAPAPGTADQTSPYGTFSQPEPGGQNVGAAGYGAPQQSGFGPATPSSGYGSGYPQAGPPPGGSTNRTPLIVGGIVVAIVLVGLVFLGVRLFSGGDEPPPTADPTTVEPSDDPTDDSTDDPTDDPTDQPTGSSDAGALTLGGNVQVSIPQEGVATATLTVDQTQVVRVYTTSTTDPVMRVLDAAGNEVATDDDSEYESSNSYDSSVQVTLTQGEYTVELHEWSGDASQVTVTAEAVGQPTALELGETDFQVDQDGVFVGILTVEPGTYTLNIVSDEDPTLEVALPGGEIEENDDRGSDAPDQDNIFDPYVEVNVSEGGEMTVLIDEYGGNAFNGTITIEQQ